MNATIYIQNLKCGGCAYTVTKNLTAIEGVSNVFVNVETSAITFEFATEKKLEEVKSTLQKLGYPEDGEVNSLTAKAKSYVSCAVGKISK